MNDASRGLPYDARRRLFDHIESDEEDYDEGRASYIVDSTGTRITGSLLYLPLMDHEE